MLEKKLSVIENKLLRDSSDLDAWMDLAKTFSREGKFPESLRKEENLNYVVSALGKNVANDSLRRLYAKIGGVKLISDDKTKWFEENGRLGMGETGAYDLVTGLPIKVEKFWRYVNKFELVPPMEIKVKSRKPKSILDRLSLGLGLLKEKEYTLQFPGSFVGLRPSANK